MDSKPYRYISKAINLDLYNELVSEIKPKRELMTVTYSDAKILERRETAWQTETDISAEYSGKTMDPVPFTPTVYMLKKKIEEIIGVEFDSALIFHYTDGKDSMGYHYDTIGVGRGNHIAGVTFGASRCLGVRNNETNEKEFFNLGNGDIFYMFDDCQKKYKHAILESKEENPGPRIAITFRQMGPKLSQKN